MTLVMFLSVIPRMYHPNILFLLDTLSATWLLCLFNDSEVSRWTPKIFWHCTRGGCESSIIILGWVLAWCVSRVNNTKTDGAR